MKKILTKVFFLLSAVIILAGNASNVAFAESAQNECAKKKLVVVRHAACYQNGYCGQNGTCDVNGVCQNGGYCLRRPHIQSETVSASLTCTHDAQCLVHNGSCPDITCTHNSNCQVHNGSCSETSGYQNNNSSGHHNGGHHGSGSHH